jgi:NAD(P)-dependent dehydrogenase (short-subunit alcohol dehydrogenase family)
MLSEKVAIVTGSSQGIGLAVAQAYLENGASVILNAEHSVKQSTELATLLARFPDHAHYVQANLLLDHDAQRLVSDTVKHFGRVDVLVNNLGTYREPSFLEITKNDFDFIFGLNVWSAMAVTQAVARRMISTGCPGRILFSTSLNATRSEPTHALYDSSKGAINALCRQLAIELAPYGITTAAIAPGLVETPLTDFGLRSDPDARRLVEQQIPLRRIASVNDLAAWYVFLASDAARYATGIVVPVDGGLDAQQMAYRPITAAEVQDTSR